MNQAQPAVYLPTDRPGTFESTELSNAGWYEEGQHGGALAALITGEVEKVPTLTPMEVARVSVELFRVVPLVPLTVETSILREGKKIQTVQAIVSDPNGTLLSVAIVQRLRIAHRPLPMDLATPVTTLAPPGESEVIDSESWGHGDPGKVMFHRNAIEVRQIHGRFAEKGPGAIWARLVVPIVAGEDPTAAQRAVMVADFCNGVSAALDPGWVFMNSDLTVHLGRHPDGEWVALDAVSIYQELGRGVAAGLLWDQGAWVGRSAQTLFLDRG
ncbi:MAG: thioesterase family protein [Acidimicrobiia bacterium]